MVKKILSIVLAFSMVLSMCSLSVFAEDAEVTVDADVQAVADAITAEMLTQDNEPSHLVTKNLDMSLEGDITLPEGVSVTFASSDTKVIANDGTVTRTSTYDGDAKVIATVSKEGSASVTKELPFTVLKTETTVLMSDNFYYPSLKDSYLAEYNTETSKIVSNLSGWTYTNCTAANIPTNVETKIKSFSDGYAIDYKRLNTETGSTVNVKKTMNITAADTDVLSLNMTNHVVDWGSGTKRIDLILYATTTAGVKKFGEIRFADTYAAIYDYDEETSAFKSTSASNVKLSAGTDRKIEIKIDYAKKTYTLFMDGTQVGIVANIPDYEYTEKLNYFTMDIIRQNLSPVELLVKDLSVTSTAVSAIRYEELTSQSPNAITQSLNLPTDFNGKTVTWVSSNPSAIATNGTVTRGAEEQDVTLTAKIEGEEDKVFNFSVLSNRVTTKLHLSTENFENIDAYKAIWGTGNGGGNGVAIDGVKDANLTFTQTIVDKGEGEASRVLYLHRANEDQTKTCYGLSPVYLVGKINGKNMYSNGIITIKSQLCFDFKEGETPRYSITFYERGNAGDQGDKVVFNYATGKVGVGDYSYTGKLPARGEWFDLEIMIDTKREMIEAFIDGVSIVGHEMELANSYGHDYYGTSASGVPGISGIYFNCNTANTGMYMDNLALYSINDAEYYSDVNEYGMYTNKEPVTDYDFSLAVVGDIQKVTYHWPENVPTIYNWIEANAEEKNIVRAVSLGDITEKDTEAEYNIVEDAFKALDGVVPHTIVRGNHDVANFDKYITYEEYKDTVDGSYNQSMRNTYNLFEQGGRKYMLLNLDCGAKDPDLEWANEVVAAHPDYNVIVATHLYMYRNGRTIDSWYGVEDYGQNSGTTIWNDFVSLHENIVMVLCGHVSTDRVVMNERVGVNGNVVKEFLINPQSTDLFYDGGTGMVTMFYFSEDGKTVQVENYSTIQEAFYRKDCQFTFDLAVIEPEISELSIGEIAKDSEKITFTVTGAEAEESTSVIAALYDENYKLIEVKKYASAASVPAELKYNATAKYARAFWITNDKIEPKAVNAEKEIR